MPPNVSTHLDPSPTLCRNNEQTRISTRTIVVKLTGAGDENDVLGDVLPDRLNEKKSTQGLDPIVDEQKKRLGRIRKTPELQSAC